MLIVVKVCMVNALLDILFRKLPWRIECILKVCYVCIQNVYPSIFEKVILSECCNLTLLSEFQVFLMLKLEF